MHAVRSVSRVLFVSAALLMAACANQMEPAQKAITEVQAALDAVSEDARKYVPEQYNEALKKLNAIKVAYNRNNYEDAIAGAPEALKAAQGLAAITAAGKEEFLKKMAVEWTALNESLPKLVAALEIRGVALEKAKQLPPGVNMDAARRGVVETRDMWMQALEASKQGRVEAAVITAKNARRRGEYAAKALQMPLPAETEAATAAAKP